MKKGRIKRTCLLLVISLCSLMITPAMIHAEGMDQEVAQAASYVEWMDEAVSNGDFIRTRTGYQPTPEYVDALNAKVADQGHYVIVEDGLQFIPKFGMMRASGVNKLEFTGSGVNIYLDSENANKLVSLLNGSTGPYIMAAAIAAAIPGGVLVTAALGVATGLIVIGASVVSYAASSGRGIIIKCYGDIPNLVPYSVVSQ